MKNIKEIIFILALFTFVAGCAGQGKQEDGLLLSESGKETQEGQEEEDSEGTSDTGLEPLIYVQVSGAVNKPGVYALPEDSRVFQAVELAGGLTEEADYKSLNQAKPLTDGEMICVMTAGEADAKENSAENPSEGAGSVDDGRVNLNTATKEELMGLPGIGEAKAGNILAWREANGGFAQIEDLMKIEGIKEGVYSKIRDCVKVQ